MRFEVRTSATPAQVRAAFTDFSEQRLTTWRRSLDPARYELREQGPAFAVAREASKGSPFWVVLRYDWSDPDVILSTVVDSSYGGEGEGHVRIEPAPSGSRVHVAWSNTGGRARWRPLLLLLHAGLLDRFIAKSYAATLDEYAARH